MSVPLSPLQQKLHHISRPLVDLLFPPSCAGCKRAGTILCDQCAQSVEKINQAICLRCGRTQVTEANTLCSLCLADKQPVLTMVRAAAFHTEPLRAIIHNFKYGSRPELAQPLGRYLLATFAAAEWQRVAIDCVAPVPMFAARQKERGYNQAELLAASFCRTVRLPLATNLLRRIRFTQAQVGLSAKERKDNVKEAFEASPAMKGKNILLIDDVYTTGATLRSCAESALQQGALRVYALALAIPTPIEISQTDSFPT